MKKIVSLFLIVLVANAAFSKPEKITGFSAQNTSTEP